MNDFFLERQRAVERMRETAKRSVDSGALPTPDFVRRRSGNGEHPKSENTKNSGFSLPFLSDLEDGGDTGLLLCLLLILYAEKADKFLLYALLYILM